MSTGPRTNEELLDAAERAAYLGSACGIPRSARQVDSLLNAHSWNSGLNDRKPNA
jgi:hypothetical protein